MAKILNLVIQDRSNIKNITEWIETFNISDEVQQPETALRNAVKEFVTSGTENAKEALDYACGGYNWGDAMSSVPDKLFMKHGLARLYSETVDVFVEHDEVLCGDIISDLDSEDDNEILAFDKIKRIIKEHIAKGEKDIKAWENCENLYAESVADKIAAQNEKLKTLLLLKEINGDLINNLINSETEDELIVIYEEILDELASFDETWEK